MKTYIRGLGDAGDVNVTSLNSAPRVHPLRRLGLWRTLWHVIAKGERVYVR